MRISKQLSFIILSIGFLLFTCGCEREWSNPFDDKSKMNHEAWSPTNLTLTVNATGSITLTWHQSIPTIDGFRIDLKNETGEWQTAIVTVDKTRKSYTDESVDLSAINTYRVCAFAGNNASSYAEAEYIPITVTTSAVTNVTATSAISGGEVIGSHVDSQGIAFGTSPNPDISGNIVQAGSSAGSFTVNMSGLNVNTVYYVRAYATNKADTAYGENVSFTSQANLPNVTTSNVTNIASNSATVSGNVISDGGATVFERGIAIGTAPNPTIEISIGSGTGSYSANLTGQLTHNTTYYLRAYAKNKAGIAYGDNVMFKTLVLQCGTNITFLYNGQQVTYGTKLRNNRCWMDRNLGASRVPTSSTDALGFGDLFQWGRLDDGHQKRTSNTSSILSNNDVPGHGEFITVSSSPMDWRWPQNDNLWQGAAGINNPCPDGWRLPTATELNVEKQSWSSNSLLGAYASSLKWPVGGYRNSYGDLWGEGVTGYVWSSSVWFDDVFRLYFHSTFAGTLESSRANGMSVRCIKD